MSALLVIFGILLGTLVGALGSALLSRGSAERMREQLRELSGEGRQRMRDEMKAISADVLKQTGDSLAQRLEEARRAEQAQIAGEMATRTEQIKGLVAPVSEKLGKVEGEIARLERERRQAQGELANMVRQLHEGVGTLRTETGNLVSALKRPNTRGSWGEIQLRNVIEMAGMIEHCDFLEQSSVSTDEGMLRPDVLVKLPGGKVIVVDSKVPLDAYLAHLEAQSDQERAMHLVRHARQTREHITKLASKGYQRQFDQTPDLVAMFVPSDGIYQAALAQDPGLIEYGVHQQVLMATPTTLIGLLRAVHYGWRQEQIAESARAIAEAGRELHKRLAVFVDPLAKVGRQLGSAVEAYNQAARSFDARLAPKARELAQMGASSGRELTVATPIESSPQPPTAQIDALQPDQRALDPLADGGPISASRESGPAAPSSPEAPAGDLDYSPPPLAR
ncbi:MAG: DNA recombination protein RmuC [Solirubrobacteraceae bacterium]